MNIGILTVGTRDVQIKGEYHKEFGDFLAAELSPETKGRNLRKPRESGELVLEEIRSGNLSFEKMEFPMLAAFLEHIQKNNIELSKIQLVATNQPAPPSTLAHHHDRDTIFLAQIIQLYLSKTLPGVAVEIFLFEGYIPNLQDAYHSLKKHFKEENAFFTPQSNGKYWLMLQGGVDTINTSLLLHTIEFYDQCTFLAKAEGVREPRIEDFQETFRTDLKAKELRKLLEHYQYYAAAQLFPSDSTEGLLAIYAHHRLNFDQNSAKEIWSKLAKRDGKHRARIEHQLSRIELKNNPKDLAKARLVDNVLAARFAYLDQQSSLMLRVLFTLSENFYSLILLEPFGDYSSTYNSRLKNSDDLNPEWTEMIISIPGLEQFLRKKYNGKCFNNWNLYILQDIFTFLYRAGALDLNPNQMEKSTQLFQALLKIRDLRNEVVHQGKGFNISQVERNLKGYQSMDIFFRDLEIVFAIQGHEPYATINRLILELMGTES